LSAPRSSAATYIKFLYTGEIKAAALDENIEKFLCLGDKYAVPELKQRRVQDTTAALQGDYGRLLHRWHRASIVSISSASRYHGARVREQAKRLLCGGSARR
jgi:hypothetical protein